jgi:hypothetical protein
MRDLTKCKYSGQILRGGELLANRGFPSQWRSRRVLKNLLDAVIPALRGV